MDKILRKIEKLALTYDKPSPAMIAKHNIKLGLRNDDGSGVVVGITSKGQVIGYTKEPKSNFDSENFVLNSVHIPGLPDGTHVSPALAVYYILNGTIPDEKKLSAFEKKLVELKEFKVNPVPGRLYYCGYNIEDIVNQAQKENRFVFDETVYTLLTGELPTKHDLQRFSELLVERRTLPDFEKRMILLESKNDDQMGALHRVISSMSRYDSSPNSTDIKEVTRQCIELIAKFPAIVAYNYNAMVAARKGNGNGLIEPREGLNTAGNFLYMLKGEVPDSLTEKLFDIALTLHAEHGGGNNSTFSVRAVSSSGANTYMAISSGIASLSGHLHGGANEAVMKLMEDIKKNVRDWKDDEEIEAYLKHTIKPKEEGGKGDKIYGMGHAVYTISDPRAIIIKGTLTYLIENVDKYKNKKNEFELYNKVAEIATKLLSKKKVVSSNVDFYSGFLYSLMDIPHELFTPIFAMARVTGWSAHRLEQIIQGRILRPAYVSSLTEPNQYLPLQNR